MSVSSRKQTMEPDSPKYKLDDQMVKKSNQEVPLLDLKGVK